MNQFKTLLSGTVASIALGAALSAYGQPAKEVATMESVQHLKDYQVVEFRRYVTADGKKRLVPLRKQWRLFFEALDALAGVSHA